MEIIQQDLIGRGWSTGTRSLVAVVLALLLFKILRWFQDGRQFRRQLAALPTPIGLWPLIGHGWMVWDRKRSIHEMMFHMLRGMSRDLGYRHGIFRFHFGPQPTVAATTGPAMEAVLSSTQNLRKSSDVEYFSNWLGNGLITSYGDHWRVHRKIITPTFNLRILDDFMEPFNRHTCVLTDRVIPELRGMNKWINLSELTPKLSLDIICETAMGVNLECQTSPNPPEYLKAVHEITECLMARIMDPTQWIGFIYKFHPTGRRLNSAIKRAHLFTNQILQERVANWNSDRVTLNDGGQKSPKKKWLPFLDRLLDIHFHDGTLSLDDVREESDTFVFAGHDTTSMALQWIIYSIGSYPEVQEKLIDELDQVFADHARNEVGAKYEDVTMDNLRDLEYLDMVIKEVLRLHPAVPYSFRKVETEFTMPADGYRIPAGVDICLNIDGLHRDPSVFPDPEKFDPDRFSVVNSVGRHPFAYGPFSAGPRGCIGQRFAMMELKVITANLFRRYRVTPERHVTEIPGLVNGVNQPGLPMLVAFQPRFK